MTDRNYTDILNVLDRVTTQIEQARNGSGVAYITVEFPGYKVRRLREASEIIQGVQHSHE